jgi:hypothetical protein
MAFPSFLLPWFAWGGVAAAVAAVIIHLLNRRRFKIIEWAAMDFLREAVFRNRRILRIRDLLLLALRVLCLLLFGAALARPYFTRTAELTSPSKAVHAVMLIDNSLSTSYKKFDGNPVLNDIKQKARETMEQLPVGSRISVVPVCGPPMVVNYEAYYSAQEAQDALDAIQPVDSAARPGAIIDDAFKACQRLSTMTGKQIYFITDQQVNGWTGEGFVENLKRLPVQMQVLQVAPDYVENAWVADVRLRDGVADTQSSGVFVATIGYQGENPRTGVQVTLKVDGATIASQTVDLQNGTREVQFPPHRFDVAVEPGKPAYVTAEVSLPPDRLTEDDQRYLVVPVVASLPVVFVDQWGAEEDPQRNRYGETRWLRSLLAPLTSRTAQDRQLIQVRHRKLDQLTRETLADARLVVIAGVPSPQGATTLLKEYVEQGGNLIIAPGADFDPVAWNQFAWSDGLGLLPASLKPDPVGHLRDDPLTEPFVLDPDTLVHDYFHPEGSTAEDVREWFGPPTLFFKAVAAEVDEESAEKVAEAVKKHVEENRKALAEADKKLLAIDKQLEGLRSTMDAGAAKKKADLDQQKAELERKRAEVHPDWLTWKSQQDAEDSQLPIDEVAQRAKPRVMGRFMKDNLPFMVRRYWGKGQVLLVTTSLSPQWTTMPNVRQSWWIMDRVARDLLTATLPRRTGSTERTMVLPVSVTERAARFTLTDPSGQEQVLTADALGGERYGLSLGNLAHRNVYRVAAKRTAATPQEGLDTKLWEVPIAVNGPAEESEIKPADDGQKSGRLSFVAATQAASGSIMQFEGMDLWKWAMTLALVGLIGELGLLAWFGGAERK